MRLTREVKFGVWVVAAVAIGVGAFVIGASLKPEEPPYYVYDVAAPAYQGDLGLIAATSPGGFTGFGDLTSSSRTVLGGRIVELTSDGMVLETPAGARTTMRLGPEPRLSRLVEASRDALVQGAGVMVRLGADEGEAESVLVTSP